MGDFERTVREFKRTLTGGRQKTAPLDIMGKVTRVEDGVAWVRFAGSEVGDTPVRMNIAVIWRQGMDSRQSERAAH